MLRSINNYSKSEKVPWKPYLVVFVFNSVNFPYIKIWFCYMFFDCYLDFDLQSKIVKLYVHVFLRRSLPFKLILVLYHKTIQPYTLPDTHFSCTLMNPLSHVHEWFSPHKFAFSVPRHWRCASHDSPICFFLC